jgi:hypothetical protein
LVCFYVFVQLLLDQLDAKELQLESLLIDNEGMSPLHHAAAAGNEQNCELLLGPTWRMPLDLRDKWDWREGKGGRKGLA